MTPEQRVDAMIGVPLTRQSLIDIIRAAEVDAYAEGYAIGRARGRKERA